MITYERDNKVNALIKLLIDYLKGEFEGLNKNDYKEVYYD